MATKTKPTRMLRMKGETAHHDDLVEVMKKSLRKKSRRSICTICDSPIEDGVMRGTGDGTGRKFAHERCYWRREAKGVEPTLTWVRAYIATIEAAYGGADTPMFIADTAKLHVLKKVLELLEVKKT